MAVEQPSISHIYYHSSAGLCFYGAVLIWMLRNALDRVKSRRGFANRSECLGRQEGHPAAGQEDHQVAQNLCVSVLSLREQHHPDRHGDGLESALLESKRRKITSREGVIARRIVLRVGKRLSIQMPVFLILTGGGNHAGLVIWGPPLSWTMDRQCYEELKRLDGYCPPHVGKHLLREHGGVEFDRLLVASLLTPEMMLEKHHVRASQLLYGVFGHPSPVLQPYGPLSNIA